MAIKGILFDFDGTLANTIDLIIKTFEHTCKEVLGFVPAREEIISTFGLPLADAMLKLSHRPELVEQMRDIYREYNKAHHDEMIKPIPGVTELLQGLRQRGLSIGIVTSKKPEMLARGLRCLQLEQYIDATAALGSTEHSKPHPEPTLKACELLGLQPQQCLCVGDSPFDLQSGKSAGAATVAVRYTCFNWKKLLQEGRPDYIINNPLELLQMLDNINKKEA